MSYLCLSPQRRAVIVFCGSENDGKLHSACMALYDNYENVERAGDKKPKKIIQLVGAKVEEPTYASPVGSQGSPGSGGTPLEKACQFLVIHSNEVNEFRSESGDMKVHWLKLLTLLTMFPYSVIPEEPSSNPISEGFRYKLDPKSYGAGIINTHYVDTHSTLHLGLEQYTNNTPFVVVWGLFNSPHPQTLLPY